jgi:hypothetical protein
MLNRFNIPAGLKADKRFDALVKRQENEHKHVIDAHHKEMQALRDKLSISMDKFDSLFDHNDNQLKDFKTYVTCTFGIIKVHLEAHEAIIEEQRKTIQDLSRQLNEIHNAYMSKLEVEKFKKDMDFKIDASTTKHINISQEMQREVKVLILDLNNDLAKMRNDMEQGIAKISDFVEGRLAVARLEKDGVLKEVRIYEKTIFIIEKKIENIYTLIERINNRDAPCHKPE